MKIAIIQNVPINDHRMIHTDGIARELLKRGYEVDVIIQGTNEKSQFNDLSYNITYILGDTYSFIGQLKFIYGLFKLLNKREYNIIHAKNPFSSILPALLSKSKAKIIYDIRGLWIDFGVHAGKISKKTYHVLRNIDMLCMKKADKVIAISNELKELLVKRGLNEDKIDVIIGDGVDLKKARLLDMKDIRNFLGIKGKIIGYVGNIGHYRYSERIIEAFDIVYKKINSAKLVMIGPLSEEEYFKKLINNLDLNEYVFFTGFIPHNEALQYMKSFDVSVSYHEGNLPIYNVAVPTKILEYLATGCSIVTTDHKMYQNILTHGKDGYLTGQDPNSFAQGILHVLHDEELSKRMSKNSLITSEKYSLRTVAKKVERLYLDTYVNDDKI